ncbi:MAG: ABC transporter ATP-binding protein [Candidatus Moranbacteria bacterium]|nr:ABC transporter ATP-binding protein [Candidatus Moranbacteria bacterium]
MDKQQKPETKQFDSSLFWGRLWQLVAPSHKQIRQLVVLIVVVEVTRMAGPYLLKLVIDTITHLQADSFGWLFLLLMAMFASNQAVALLNFFADKKIFAILGDVLVYLSQNAHRNMVFLDLSYHEKEDTGNKITKIQRGVDKIEGLIGSLFWEVVPTLFQAVFSTIVLFAIDWRFGVLFLIFVPLFVIMTFKLNKNVFEPRKKRYTLEEEASGLMTQSIININTVKSFVQEKPENSRFRKKVNTAREMLLLEFSKVRRYNLGRFFIIDSGRITLLMTGVYLVWHGSITVGSLVFVYTISEKALLSLFRISRLYDQIMQSSEAVNRLHELSSVKSEIINPKAGVNPKSLEGLIEFRDMSFQYSGSKRMALKAVSVKIPAGSMTALVGPSGGGKTTLARMVYRHYDPTRGEVLLDNVDLKSYDLYAFRRHMAIVPQEVEVFNTSVRDNIGYAKEDATLEEIQAAAKIANADEFITGLSGGYDTLVGERGIKLSGGQRQRLGIARAILANPKVLIFDEATSSLDSQSERLIQEAMDKISKNRTVIVIAHRLSTIKKADKIIVLEKGQVVEEGNHRELSSVEGGLYQKLLKLQAMGDVD